METEGYIAMEWTENLHEVVELIIENSDQEIQEKNRTDQDEYDPHLYAQMHFASISFLVWVVCCC